MDKFSKWIEARPITNLKAEQVVSFFTDIIHRFRVLNSIITDNGSQFTGRKFLEFRDKYHIRVDWAAVAHPQTNGQVERANSMIVQGLEYRSPKVKGYDESANQRAHEDSLDQLDEARTVALMHSARYQQELRRYQAGRIWRRDFDEGDLVLRLRQDYRGRHKLPPPWEGPYVVVKVIKPGTYKLANEDGEELTNAWNIQQLRRFYP
jgi:transposase InsO family protein